MPTTATASARIDVLPDTAWAWFSLALGAAAGLTLATWVLTGLSWSVWVTLAARAVLAVTAAVLALRVLRAPAGTLRRHHEVWWWHPAGQSDLSTESGTRGDVVVTIDLGRWMLVRFEPIDAREDATPQALSPRRRRRPLWLPLSARAAGGATWSAWRALLLSRRATLPDHVRQADARAARADR